MILGSANVKADRAAESQAVFNTVKIAGDLQSRLTCLGKYWSNHKTVVGTYYQDCPRSCVRQDSSLLTYKLKAILIQVDCFIVGGGFDYNSIASAGGRYSSPDCLFGNMRLLS